MQFKKLQRKSNKILIFLLYFQELSFGVIMGRQRDEKV